MPLYQITSGGNYLQIKPSTFRYERELQRMFEANLEVLLGVRFVAREYTTGDRQRGRIDTLGLDQDGSPTIIEYKRTNKENVINQGLFYLDWLDDHKGDFTLVAQDALGQDIQIDWSNPRLILIAESFSEYDKYAVNRIGANIELWIYRRYGNDLLYLEPIFTSSSPSKQPRRSEEKETEAIHEVEGGGDDVPVYTVDGHLAGKPQSVVELFEVLREHILLLGEEGEITEKAVKNYIAYKHGKNFCEVWIQASKLKLWLDVHPDELHDPLGLARDVTGIGHWGTGDSEVTLDTSEKVEDVMELIEQSYQQTV